VLRRELASHDVKYELNAYRVEGEEPEEIRSELHARILDHFHDEGVQIMTPFYVADPAELKIPRGDGAAPTGLASARTKGA
jgi:small-conductance mechanosensitive channel